MSSNKDSTPVTPSTPTRTSNNQPTPQAPYRPTVERLVSDTTNNTTARVASNALPSCRMPQYNEHGNLADVMARTYPTPTDVVNVAEALELPPQPKTFKHHLDDLRKNGERKKVRIMTDEDRKAEFERVKATLRSLGQKPSSS
jgi:hypothetical protein